MIPRIALIAIGLSLAIGCQPQEKAAPTPQASYPDSRPQLSAPAPETPKPIVVSNPEGDKAFLQLASAIAEQTKAIHHLAEAKVAAPQTVLQSPPQPVEMGTPKRLIVIPQRKAAGEATPADAPPAEEPKDKETDPFAKSGEETPQDEGLTSVPAPTGRERLYGNYTGCRVTLDLEHCYPCRQWADIFDRYAAPEGWTRGPTARHHFWEVRPTRGLAEPVFEFVVKGRVDRSKTVRGFHPPTKEEMDRLLRLNPWIGAGEQTAPPDFQPSTARDDRSALQQFLDWRNTPQAAVARYSGNDPNNGRPLNFEGRAFAADESGYLGVDEVWHPWNEPTAGTEINAMAMFATQAAAHEAKYRAQAARYGSYNYGAPNCSQPTQFYSAPNCSRPTYSQQGPPVQYIQGAPVQFQGGGTICDPRTGICYPQ
jgi:hypothetical protein